ncbi:MAG: hypothetical protein AAF481_12355 [Acidobacteriota bacterium]
MIDLNAPLRTVAGVDLAVDSEQPTRFHVLPAKPRVARKEFAPADGDGVVVEKPDLGLLRFLREGEVTGGHLHLGLEAGYPAERLEACREELADELSDDGVELVAVTPVSASAELLFLGRETDDDGGLSGLVRRGYGWVAAGVDAPHRSRFAVDLDPAGVALMEAAMVSGGAPVGVIYRFGIEGLWPALEAVARVDWERVYDHFSSHERRGVLLAVEDIQRIREDLEEEGAIAIEVVRGLSGEHLLTDPSVILAWIQREMVERFCEPVMPMSREPARASLGGVGELLGAGFSYAVKARTQIERAQGVIDFNRRAVVSRTLTAEAHLADLLGDSPVEEHLSDAETADHPFFRRFRLEVESTRPLSELHLEEAVLHFSFGTHDDSGQLAAANRTVQFESWADASADGTWSLLPEVRFADEAPIHQGEAVQLPVVTGDSRALSLDFGRLLGLRELRLEAPADERVLMCRVKVNHRRGEEIRDDREVVLTGDHAAETVWFHDFEEGDQLEVLPAYLTAEGRQVTQDPLIADTRILRLPPAFPGRMTVQLLSDDDWTDLDQVVVAVQKSETAPAGTFTFSGPGELVPVALDLPDPADRSFRYRVARTWSSGAVEEDDWTTSDASLVVVGRVASDRLVVDVVPVGPELTAAGILLIEVELAYVDVPNRVRELDQAVFRARADRHRWQIALADPQLRTYEYRVIVHRTSGDRETGPWTTTGDQILTIPIVASL